MALLAGVVVVLPEAGMSGLPDVVDKLPLSPRSLPASGIGPFFSTDESTDGSTDGSTDCSTDGSTDGSMSGYTDGLETGCWRG